MDGGLNRFAYAGGDPVNFVDPTGLDPVAIQPLAGAIERGLSAFEGSRLAGGIVQFNGLAREVSVLPQVQLVSFGTAPRDVFEAAATGGLLGLGGAARAPARTPAMGTDAPTVPTLTAENASIVTRGIRNKSLVPFNPPNDGFLGAPRDFTLIPGARIDRIGFDGGRFLSPAGTPIPMRALRPGTETRPLRTFEVARPFDVRAGEIAPAFG